MINGDGHNFGVDWWAIGILIFELIVGVTPFYCQGNGDYMIGRIKSRRVVFPDPKTFTNPITSECKDLICGLLHKDSKKRLGSNGGLKEVFSHPWFSMVDSKEILDKSIIPPFIPDLEGD